MANARGKEIDNTHLSIDQAEARGFIHRDYIAHCLRWTKIAKDLNLGGKYKEADIIDVGCGKDMPLARMLMTNRMAPRRYLGVEYNKMELPSMFDNTTFKPELMQDVNFVTTDIMEDSFNVSVCLEVLEHVEPSMAIMILDQISNVVVQDGICYFSTPCFDEKVGAAKNHVNEMTYRAFGALLEARGFQILDHYGTFASQKDYKHHLDGDMNSIFSKLSEYYDTNYLATIFAPLYPSKSRNVLWKCANRQNNDFNRRFTVINEIGGRLGSSEKAGELRFAAGY
jgi:2-polyprenyl-3-methyl-5-hydroxy-6-metoxy-1,4-benzoquinol methylase